MSRHHDDEIARNLVALALAALLAAALTTPAMAVLPTADQPVRTATAPLLRRLEDYLRGHTELFLD